MPLSRSTGPSSANAGGRSTSASYSPECVERSLVDILLEELYSFVGEGWEQEDDITLLTLRRSAFLS
jgi:hypothetical protein